jgi:hypothetical protein
MTSSLGLYNNNLTEYHQRLGQLTNLQKLNLGSNKELDWADAFNKLARLTVITGDVYSTVIDLRNGLLPSTRPPTPSSFEILAWSYPSSELICDLPHKETWLEKPRLSVSSHPSSTTTSHYRPPGIAQPQS